MGRFSEANAPVTEAGTFPTPQPQTRPFSSSSSVLYPSDSASQLNAQPSPTPPVFPSHECGSTSTSSILNGAEDFLRPGTSSLSMKQGSTPTQGVAHTMSSRAYDQESLRDNCALPQHPPEPSSVRLQHGATRSQYWNDGHGPMRTSNQPYMEHLASQRPMSSTACSAPATGFSHPPINLYEPRPSTAPMIESQGLSEMLPPKRDLPFPKPIPRSGTKASKNTKYMAEIVLPALAPKENNKIPATSSLPSDSQELETQSAPPTAKVKRAPAKKTCARVTKKPAAPRSRKKAASMREASPVPSVEELLKRSQESAKGVITMSKTIDTQALLARVEERQAVVSCQNPISKHSVAPSFAHDATAAAREDPSEVALAPLRPTGREQVTDLSLSEEQGPQAKIFTTVTEVHDFQERRHSSSQAVPAVGQGNPPDFLAAAPNPPPVRQTLSEQRQNITSTSCDPSVQPLANPLTGPLASLLRDPDFADSSNLAQWAKNPEDERRASLETFICRNIQDENFFKLCNDLDGTWQRVFLGKIV
jgi:hypothetical protein